MAPPRLRAKTSAYPQLDARRIAREHGFPAGAVVTHRLVGEWSQRTGWVVLEFESDAIIVQNCVVPPWAVGIERTELRSNGGWRWWFQCPTCARRCAVLYLRAGTWPGCRKCMSLAYPSQSEGVLARKYRRRDKLAGRMGWDVAKPFCLPRPKGMWRRTYLAALEEFAGRVGGPLRDVHALANRL